MADFLQEVTSRKDQAQYWFLDQPYRFVPVAEMAAAFQSTQAAQRTRGVLEMPYDRAACPEGSLVPSPNPPSPSVFLRSSSHPARSLILWLCKHCCGMMSGCWLDLLWAAVWAGSPDRCPMQQPCFRLCCSQTAQRARVPHRSSTSTG